MLQRLYPELLFMVAEELPLSSHSSLSMTSRHLQQVVQPLLHQRMKALPHKDVDYAMLAIYWAFHIGNHDALRHHLSTYPSVTVLFNRHLTWVPAPSCAPTSLPPGCNFTLHTTGSPPKDHVWERIIHTGPEITLTPSGTNRGQPAIIFALCSNAHGLLRLTIEKTPILNMAVLLAGARASPESLKIVLDEVRRRGGQEEWETWEKRALRYRLSTRGITALDTEPGFLGPRSDGGVLHRIVRGEYFARRLLSDVLTRVDVSGVDAKGRTALHEAAELNDSEIVHILCEAGAGVDIRDNDGITAMELVLKKPWSEKKWAVLEVLKAFGADLDLESAEGITPNQMMGRRLRSRSRIEESVGIGAGQRNV